MVSAFQSLRLFSNHNLTFTHARYFSTLKKVGFVGLGNMGMPMAKNLLKAKYEVVVYDINPASVDELKSFGALTAKCVTDVAAEADVFISMVPAAKHVNSLYYGDAGVFSHGKAQSLLIDCSTVDPVTSMNLAKEAKKRGFRMIDAPVSGGVVGAINKTLTFMIGGSEADVEEAKPYLTQMGTKLVYCGDNGKGSAVKVCNNLILGISMLGVAEGFKLANKLGVDLKRFAEVVNTSSGRCWSSDTYCPVPGILENVPASRNYVGGFATDLMIKDLDLALTAGDFVKCPLPTTKTSKLIYEKVSKKGLGTRDFGCIYENADDIDVKVE